MQLNVLFVFQPLHRFLYLFYYECVFVHMIPVKMKQFSVALSDTFTIKIFELFLKRNLWELPKLGISLSTIQSAQKENKSEQALQIIGHVVAEFCTNRRSMDGRRQVVVSNDTS
jgi:hypothetical protein